MINLSIIQFKPNIILYGLIMLIPTWLNGQKLLQQATTLRLSIEEFGVDRGLSQGMIHGMAIDLKGYLWVGTKDGLNRYDGNHFQVFRNDPLDSTSIASNYIRSLHIDHRGLIWVGTISSGLELYNPSNAGFIHFGKSSNKQQSQSFQSISNIFSDPEGRILIWDGTGEQAEILSPLPGKNLFHQDAWTSQKISEVYHIDPDIPKPNSQSMIGFDENGALIYSHNQTIYWLYPTKINTWAPKVYEENNVTYFMDPHRRLYCYNDKEKVIYVWNNYTLSFVPIIRFPPEERNSIGRFWVDHQYRIWCYSDEHILFRINVEEGLYRKMVLESKNFEIDKSAIFKNFCEDQNHNLWFGSAGYGIVKFSSRNDQFINEYLISDDLLGACISKKEGGNELHDVINQSDKQLLAQKIKRDGYLINSYCFAEDPITSKLWILGFSPEKNQSILVQFNPVDKTHTILPIEICQIQANESFNLLKFDSLGHLWASIECSDNVVRLYTIPFPDSDLIEYTFPIKHIQSEHSFVSDWLIDQKGAFWLGTKQGLFHFQPKSGEWKQWHPDPTSSHALSHDHILSLCPDPVYPDRFLWIGTDGGGLNKMDIQQETFRTFSTQNGLTNNVVYGVLADQHDNLWISSNRGLNLIHPDTGIIQSFSQQDGLPSDEFNRFEFGKTSDQKLYFGSIGGAVVFDPEVFYISSVASPLVINRLWLSGKEVHFRNLNPDLDTHFILPAPLENCTKIILPYSERMLTLGFSLLDFTNPNGIKYRYKLEGFNQDWVESNIDNVAGFTNLSPGRYTFLVSGLNSYNIWSDPTSLEILIQPPWWGTWWFRSIIVLCIISLVYLFYRYRLQQAMRLQHLRNRIAADLHDEIGSTLSSIALAGTVIQHKLKTTDHEVNGLLNKINHHTQSMMEAMSDIVWAVNTKNDRFDQVLHRMRAFSVEILEPKEVTIHFTVAPGVTPLLLDMQQRKNLYLIFKESIHNIAKYAHCEWVQVVITYMHGDLRMEVKDNGVGFASDQTIGTNNSHQGKNLGGNGIQNMYQRAKELKGKLEVESSLGAGTKIVLIFPV